MIITDKKHFEVWQHHQPITIDKHLAKFAGKKVFPDFGYNLTLSAVNSSQIEGNPINMADYYDMKDVWPSIYTKAYNEITNLKEAYEFAAENPLNAANILQAHRIITDTVLHWKERGVLRQKEVQVKNMRTNTVVYTGCKVDGLVNAWQSFTDGLAKIIKAKQTDEDSFFYAAQLHFWFSAIHPFADGNGRTSRLIEKWYLAEKIGKVAWKIPTEFMYRDRIKQYHARLNKAGKSFETINPGNTIDFLLMLPMALTIKVK